MAEVEILLGTCHGARYLGAQLASLAGQSLSDWTLLASDDGSTDHTRAMLERFGRARPGAGLRVIDGPQAGFAANYLHLLDHADPHASFVALADQDDVWLPDKLRRAVAALRDVPRSRPAAYAAQSLLIDAAGLPIGRVRQAVIRPSFANALAQNVMAGNTIVLNQAAVRLAQRARPKSLPPFHDWWLYALLSGAGASIRIDPTPVLGYRQHPNGLLGAHKGAFARLTRGKMVLNGTWKHWLQSHHAALESVAHHLLPQHRLQLYALTAQQRTFGRFAVILRTGIHRQARLGTAAFGVAALAGLA